MRIINPEIKKDGTGVKSARALVGNLPLRRLLSPWLFTLLLIIFSGVFIRSIIHPKSINSVMLLTSMIVIAAMGQSFVILVGGIDLSIPMTAAYGGIFITWFSEGLNGPLIWLIPVVLAFGCFVGLVNGFGVVSLKVHPIVMTMGVSAILEGAIMLLTLGLPRGYAPSIIIWFSTGKIGGIFVSILFMIIMTILVGVLQSYSSFGLKLYAVGNNRKVAFLSGIRVRIIEMLAYVLSGLFSAILGIMLTGFVGESYFQMGQGYLLISVAAVAVGGAQMNGGKGHCIGTLGGAVMLGFLSVILASFLLPEGVRNILFGIVILLAIIGIREKRLRS